MFIINGIIEIITMILVTLSFAGYTGNSQTISETSLQKDIEISSTKEQEAETVDLQIMINEKTFSAKLYNNETTKKLVEQLPMTIQMGEMNGNEKYYFMPNSLPTNSGRPEQIKAGDIMLYGSDCLVLFYESFSTSYNYTTLGYIEDAENFSKTVGSGSVTLTLDLKYSEDKSIEL